jgi:hypothetical protein
MKEVELLKISENHESRTSVQDEKHTNQLAYMLSISEHLLLEPFSAYK